MKERARKRLIGWVLALPAGAACLAEIPDPTPSPAFMLGALVAAFGAALIYENGGAAAR